MQSLDAANAISDLNPNAADLLITSILTSMVADLGVITPTSGALLTYFDSDFEFDYYQFDFELTQIDFELTQLDFELTRFDFQI